MKNEQKGFIGIAVIILVALAMIGGGAYMYTQKESSESSKNPVEKDIPSVENITSQNEVASTTTVKSVVNTESKPVVKAESLKTFTQSAGIYSARYPSSWTYSEGELLASFETVAEGTSQTFDIGLGTDIDYATKILSQQSSSEKVTRGANLFTRFTRVVEPYRHVVYILPVGTVEGKTTYLSVLVEEFTKIDTNDFNAFLGSIRVDPTKASIIVKREISVATSAQIRSNVSSMRAYAELYYDASGSYSGMCDGSSSESVKVEGINKILESVLKLVSPGKVYCNSSSGAFVYSVEMPSGDTVCSDSTGFSGTITTNPKTLSCK